MWTELVRVRESEILGTFWKLKHAFLTLVMPDLESIWYGTGACVLKFPAT